MTTPLIFGPYGSRADRIVRTALVAYAADGKGGALPLGTPK
jgi:hypothetical protein